MTTQMVIAVALFLCASTTAFADPINITASRGVTAFVSFIDSEGFDGVDFQDANSAAPGRFRASLQAVGQTDVASLSTSASQDTNFDASRHRLLGSGSVSVDNSADVFAEVISAASEVELDFMLARATPFRMRGTLTRAGDAFANVGIDGVTIRNGSTTFNDHGILQPGSHSFFTRAILGENIPSQDGRASFDIDFSLGSAATPEPGSLALLATGLAATVASRRRARQYRS